MLICLATHFDIQNEDVLRLPDQTVLDWLRSDVEDLSQVKSTIVSSRLPYEEPATADEDDVQMTDVPSATGTNADSRMASPFEEIRAKIRDLKVQFPDHRQKLEEAEARTTDDIIFPKGRQLIALRIVNAIMTEECEAAGIRQRYFNLECERLKRSSAPMLRVEETREEMARQESLFQRASQVNIWAKEMWKECGDGTSLEEAA